VTKKTLIGLVLLLLLTYIGSYVLLSKGGRFEPWAIGLNGVKGYEWAPRCFVVNYKWQRGWMFVYYPLWCLDSRWWHNHLGQYPIDEVQPEEIWRVYEASGLIHENTPPSSDAVKRID
jgi:hypothetical protein